MDKGKLKNEKKYLSLILLPHFGDRTRTIKVNATYTAAVTITIVSLAALLCILTVSVYSVQKNAALSSEVSRLSDENENQKVLLDQKESTLSALRDREKNVTKDIESYTRKYKRIIDSYITKKTAGSKTNRSGVPAPNTFVNDVKELKNLLENINELKAVNKDTVNALQETEKKINKYKELVEAENRLKEYMKTVPTYWPAYGRISSRFGGRSDPFYGSTRFHEGLDIAGDYGDNIRAAGKGTVIFSGYKNGYGNTVMVSHGNGITTLYSHASKLLVREWQTVEKGDVIAEIGSTGRSTGPHLHFEIHVNGTPVDPFRYLD